MRTWIGLTLCGLALLSSGCTFRRTAINTQVRTFDLEALEIGKSTWLDVLREYGPPGPTVEERFGREDVGFDFFRYSCTDIKGFDLDISYWIQLPFSWTDEQRAVEVMVEFDDEGVVQAIHQTKEFAIWRPFQKEWKRPPSETKSEEAPRS